MQCSHVIQTQVQKCGGMHINFDAVYQGHSKFVRETSKTWTALIGSIFSDQWNPPVWWADAQFLLLHILRSSKYIKLIYVFGSAHVKIGVWIKAGPQPLLFGREERLSRSELYQPFRIGSEAVHGTSHELNSLNSIRLMWSTASEPGLRLVNAQRATSQSLSFTFPHPFVQAWRSSLLSMSLQFVLMFPCNCRLNEIRPHTSTIPLHMVTPFNRQFL